MSRAWPIYCVIPTSRRPHLLEKALASIQACRRPEHFEGVIVAENGPKSGAEAVIAGFSGSLNTRYMYCPKANKSAALNSVIAICGDSLLYFVDDDIELSPGALIAMSEAASAIGGRFLLGGPIDAEYESPPPEWLQRYLPRSAIGWELGISEVTAYERSGFFGCNWLVSAADLRRIGGFDEGVGPGTLATGQEKLAQIKLRRDGVAGYYVPEARCRHYVPRERCSPQWALKRAYRQAFSDALIQKTSHNEKVSIVRMVADTAASLIKAPFRCFSKSEEESFAILYWVMRKMGGTSAYCTKKRVG